MKSTKYSGFEIFSSPDPDSDPVYFVFYVFLLLDEIWRWHFSTWQSDMSSLCQEGWSTSRELKQIINVKNINYNLTSYQAAAGQSLASWFDLIV